ncbi:MAG TPA: NAD(P)H-dependent glycerol-3-phosphate dehydrogenase [Dehalococcoidia bacterium]|nr:NAD(P)H-dependent glycerol-3-phosphate dehydrogenase [Dehalococcoidia bacterium]
MKVAIIGTTSWGTTLGVILSRRGIDVALWARTVEEAEQLARDGENKTRLPGISFPGGLSPTGVIEEALQGASLVVLAVPSQRMRENVRIMKGHIAKGVPILSAAKGLEVDTTKRMTQVISEEIDPAYRHNICVLSGPNLSMEVVHGLPATTVIAAQDTAVAKRAQGIMASATFRVYTNDDVIGVELGGALKNIVALAAGLSDGLGYGDNAKAALVSRGLAEISRLGVAMGANPLTFAGLAGLGDLVATCSSPLSRNRFVGQELAKGRPLAEITASMTNVAEGISTTVAARRMAREYGVDMPITEQVYRVLFEWLDVTKAMATLMGRELKSEMLGE